MCGLISNLCIQQQRSAAVQAKAQQDAVEKQLRQVELQALTDVARYRHISRLANAELYRSENLAPVEKLEIATSGTGKVPRSSLLDAQRTYNLAMAAYNQARSDYQLSPGKSNRLWEPFR